MTDEQAYRYLEEAGAVLLADELQSIDDLPFIGDVFSAPTDAQLLRKIGISGLTAELDNETGDDIIKIGLLFATELALDLPGLDGLSIVLAAGQAGEQRSLLKCSWAKSLKFESTVQLRFVLHRICFVPCSEHHRGGALSKRGL